MIGLLLDWDGCSDIWAMYWDDWVNFSSSPKFAAVAARMHIGSWMRCGLNNICGADAKNFVGDEMGVIVGYDNLIFRDAVQSTGGTMECYLVN
jgi:hypothetical protein